MTGTVLARPTEMWWSPRRSRILLVAAHLPFLVYAPLLTGVGFQEPRQAAWLVVPMAISIAALQLRHSFAAARGVLPRAWPFTLVALGILVYAPLPWFQWDWTSLQFTFMASVAMLLRGRVMQVLIAASLLGTAAWAAYQSQITGGNPPQDVFFFFYWGVGLAGGTACLYGSTQLVRAVDGLFATRAEMVETTVGRERLRFSRDLHDLLGQSLSAVSLKGDLAMALLHSDPPAAEAEIHGLTQAAREALRDIRHAVHREHRVTLRHEAQGAAVLLTAASITARIDVQLQDLAPQVDELFGWATREGVTNMVRHSQAGTCSIRATRRQDGAALLEIVNDGARSSSGSGTGIAGLTERAEAVAGRIDAGSLGDGRYRLAVEVPEAFV
jgi:two-component system sensor histidine kinase DesK